MESAQREVRMIVPYGVPYSATCWVRNKLLDHFGGFTSFKVVGGWRSDDRDNPTIQSEGGTAYDIAVPDRPESDWLLLDVVRGLLERSDEQAVYVRQRDGTVEIVARPERMPVHSDPVQIAA
jgi:hypothetical protein